MASGRYSLSATTVPDKSYHLPVITYTGHQISRLEEIRSAGWWPGFQISSLEALFFDDGGSLKDLGGSRDSSEGEE